MTLSTLTRIHTFPPCVAADNARNSVPRITCRKCAQTTTRSNLTDDLCDPCHDSSVMAVINHSHGVAWRRNSEGVPN